MSRNPNETTMGENDDQPKDGAPDAAPPASPVADPDLHERYLRVHADLQNLRKRSEREVEERARRKAEGLLRGILGALDELDHALAAVPADRHADDPVVQGVLLTRESLLRALLQEGVREIPTVGQPFDPKHHEAIATLPSADTPPAHVVTEQRKGYLWGDRVLRPSQVIVAAAAPGEAAPGGVPPEGAR